MNSVAIDVQKKTLDLVPTLCVGTLFSTLYVGAVDHNNGFGKERQRLKPYSFTRWLVYMRIGKRMSMPEAVLPISPVNSTGGTDQGHAEAVAALAIEDLNEQIRRQTKTHGDSGVRAFVNIDCTHKPELRDFVDFLQQLISCHA